MSAALLARSMIGLPALTKNNHAKWKYSIEAFAAENGITDHLKKVEIPQQRGDRANLLNQKAHIGRLIISTLSPDIITALGEVIVTKNPFEMFQHIEDYFAAECTPEEHESLRRKAQAIRIKMGESIEDYVQRHNKLRQEMIRAKYPNIKDESTSVLFMIRGIQARPSIEPNVPLLLMQKIKSSKDLMAALDVLGTVEQPRPRRRPIQRWSNAPYNPVSSSEYHLNSQSPPQAGRSHFRGRGRGGASRGRRPRGRGQGYFKR